ncbi:hypothetical protein JCM15765_28830 [Paradesulfitobacterium aromaticivorans]
MSTICIVQARMGSQRLPGKVLKEIVGKPMLEHIVNRLSQGLRVDKTVIATSVDEKDNLIDDFCHKRGIAVFRGSEKDVLDRYFQAACKYNADIIIRVTADCPLIDYEGIDILVDQLVASKKDYIGFNAEKLPRGLAGEVFTFQALALAHETANQPYEREHVTIHMYENPEKFGLKVLEPPSWIVRPTYRLTVDTEDDLELVRRVYEMIQADIVNLRDVINLLDERPDLVRINSHIEQKDPKI